MTETIAIEREEYNKMLADIQELRHALFSLPWGGNAKVVELHKQTAHYEDKS